VKITQVGKPKELNKQRELRKSQKTS